MLDDSQHKLLRYVGRPSIIESKLQDISPLRTIYNNATLNQDKEHTKEKFRAAINHKTVFQALKRLEKHIKYPHPHFSDIMKIYDNSSASSTPKQQSLKNRSPLQQKSNKISSKQATKIFINNENIPKPTADMIPFPQNNNMEHYYFDSQKRIKVKQPSSSQASQNDHSYLPSLQGDRSQLQHTFGDDFSSFSHHLTPRKDLKGRKLKPIQKKPNDRSNSMTNDNRQRPKFYVSAAPEVPDSPIKRRRSRENLTIKEQVNEVVGNFVSSRDSQDKMNSTSKFGMYDEKVRIPEHGRTQDKFQRRSSPVKVTVKARHKSTQRGSTKSSNGAPYNESIQSKVRQYMTPSPNRDSQETKINTNMLTDTRANTTKGSNKKLEPIKVSEFR